MTAPTTRGGKAEKAAEKSPERQGEKQGDLVPSGPGTALQLAPAFAKAAAAIDEVTTKYAVATQAGNRFEQAFIRAVAMQELRRAVSSEVMALILPMQGSSLGFRTDKDRDGGYPADVVKECFIEATLRGANPVGNEWNIIAGRCYLTKECYERLLRQVPGIANLRIRPGTPVTGQGGALVPFLITCTLYGKPWKLERFLQEFPNGVKFDERIAVRVNSNQTIDAIIGKATRKACKAAYEAITGTTHDDGYDPDDATLQAHGAVVDVTPGTSRTDQIVQQLHGRVQPANLLESREGQESLPGRKASQQQLAKIRELAGQLEYGDADLDELIAPHGIDKVEDLPQQAAEGLIQLLAERAGLK